MQEPLNKSLKKLKEFREVKRKREAFRMRKEVILIRLSSMKISFHKWTISFL